MTCSVVIPCWNVAPWVRRCIESVLAALPRDGEVLCIDDGSTDSTAGILSGFAARDSRLRVLRIPHSGVSAARNKGLDEASGEYVFFTDPDDEVERDFYLSMIDAVRSAGAQYAVCGFCFRRDGEETKREWKLRGSYNLHGADTILSAYVSRIIGYTIAEAKKWRPWRAIFGGREIATVWRCVYRRDTIGDQRFDESVELNEDAVFNAEYLLKCDRMVPVARPLYISTERQSGAVSRISADASRLARNKIALLDARDRLDVKSGGKLRHYYEGTCVLAPLEIVFAALRGRMEIAEAFAFLKEYFSRSSVRDAWRAAFGWYIFKIFRLLLKCFFGRIFSRSPETGGNRSLTTES